MDSKTNFLLIIAILAVVVSIANLGIVYNKVDKITGFQVTDTGDVNVTINSEASIEFTDAIIEFGAGSVNDASSSAILESNNSVVGGDWTPIDDGLILLNKGNVDVNLTLTSAGSFSGFADYDWKVTDNETDSCTDYIETEDAWFDASDSAINVCGNFTYGDDADTLRIDVYLEIAEGMAPATYTDTITATGTALV